MFAPFARAVAECWTYTVFVTLGARAQSVGFAKLAGAETVSGMSLVRTRACPDFFSSPKWYPHLYVDGKFVFQK